MLRNLNCLVNTINLHVVEEGEREMPTIIFLHGFPEFWLGWKNQIQFFKDQGFHVLVPDQRGYNLSDKPPNVTDYKIELLASDIIELIKQTGKSKVYLVGHDWGAVIAWHLAITHPEYIEKLLILNVPHPLALKETIFKNLKQLLKSWYMLAFQFPWMPEVLVRRNNYAMFRNALLMAKNDSITNEHLKDYITAWSKEGAVSSMINWYRAAVRFPFKYDAFENGHVSVPTKIIWGKQDQFLEPILATKSLKYCKEGELVFLEEASHWLAHEEPQKVNELILSFLRK